MTGFNADNCINCTGGNQWPPKHLKHLFVSTSTPDLHLKNRGNYAANAGADLSDSFTGDIDGDTRTDTWDIGADEAVTGTELRDPKMYSWHETEPR